MLFLLRKSKDPGLQMPQVFSMPQVYFCKVLLAPVVRAYCLLLASTRTRHQEDLAWSQPVVGLTASGSELFQGNGKGKRRWV